jgi:hypothetical protein
VPEVKSFLFKGRSEELDVTMLLLETRLDERPKKGIAVRSNLIDAIGDAGNKIDMDEHKNTFVRLYGLEKCEELVREHTEAAIDALDVFEDSEFMRALALSLVGREM